MDNETILNIQLSEFNTCLESAVISGAEQITFIHGVGNGILRNKIHKILSQYPHIKYFEDAKKEKFGYTGERLSLNFQNIEVRAVLQLIADFTGFNLVCNYCNRSFNNWGVVL